MTDSMPMHEAKLPTTLASMGLALIIGGQPLGWIARGQLAIGPDVMYPILPIAFGIGLMLLVFMIHRADINLNQFPMLFLIGFYLIFITTISLSNINILYLEFFYTSFLIFCLFVIIQIEIIYFYRTSMWVFLFSSLASLLVLYEFFSADNLLEFSRLGFKGNSNPLQVAATAGTAVFTGLILILTKQNRPIFLSYAIMSITVGIVVLALANTRGVFIGLLAAIGFLIFYQRHIVYNKVIKFRKTLIFILISVLASIYLFWVYVNNKFGSDFVSGVLSIWGERFIGGFSLIAESDYFSTTDDSTQARIYIIDETLRDVNFLGNGMHHKLIETGGAEVAVSWAHIAPLQALADFGVVGLLYYLLVIICIPVILIAIRMRQGLSNLDLFIVCLFIYKFPIHFLNGTPYFWQLLLPSILVYAFFTRSKPSCCHCHRKGRAGAS